MNGGESLAEALKDSSVFRPQAKPRSKAKRTNARACVSRACLWLFLSHLLPPVGVSIRCHHVVLLLRQRHRASNGSEIAYNGRTKCTTQRRDGRTIHVPETGPYFAANIKASLRLGSSFPRVNSRSFTGVLTMKTGKTILPKYEKIRSRTILVKFAV